MTNQKVGVSKYFYNAIVFEKALKNDSHNLNTDRSFVYCVGIAVLKGLKISTVVDLFAGRFFLRKEIYHG